MQICNRVGVQKHRPRMPAGLPPDTTEMIRRCLHHDPSQRPSAQDLTDSTHSLVRLERAISATSSDKIKESDMARHRSLAAAPHEDALALRHWSSLGQVMGPSWAPFLFTLLRSHLAHFPPVFSRFLRVFTVSTRRFQRAPSRNPGPRNSGKGVRTPFCRSD